MSQIHLLLSLPDTESRHRVAQLLRRQAPHCQIIGEFDDCRSEPACRWLQPLPAHSLGAFKAGLEEAVSVLENSRHAFKSAQLAALRKRLSRLAEELSASQNCAKT
ncbi:hypothetical protein ACUTAF_21845 [Pseudomonas sp. SP16.1]|uniref:hypothetical protein n=1 Tax=Pseudomonas sp. SP16.1 TaxID=3458854 RepID=UPI00404571AB